MLVVAFFLVLVAWINYINLATVRSIERSKEVAIRKVVGASRTQLMRQFLMEAFLVNTISLIVAICIASLVYSRAYQCARSRYIQWQAGDWSSQ